MMRHFLLFLALAAPGALWAGWTSEIVASEGNVGSGCCLAVDRWNRPHISYVDITQGKVMYARYTDSSWEFQTIASDVTVNGDTALALDAFDNPHVIFQNDTEEEVSYAYLSGGAWEIEKVDGGPNYGLYVSISVWPTVPRVSYTVPSGFDTRLKYAIRNGGSWETESVVDSGSAGEFNDIFVDDEGDPHIFYHDGISGSIKHAVRGASEWSFDDIAAGIDCDAFLGPNGKIHLSFPKLDPIGLDYAVSTGGGSWDIENVTAAKGSPTYSQICANGAGDVYISYFDRDNYNLHVVSKKGSAWTHTLVAKGGYVGVTNSIAAGPNGYPLIAYYDSTNGDLKLARYDPLTDVELTYFTAERSRRGADVRWALSDDRSVSGYNLYRQSDGFERERVNPSPIVGASPFLYRDAEAENTAYRYWLEVVSNSGTSRTYGPVSIPPARKAHVFALLQNAPNPTSGATTFSFELAEAADVTLAIYDAAGRKVATVAEGYFPAGTHDVPFAKKLAPGVYVYRLETASNVAALKMVVTR